MKRILYVADAQSIHTQRFAEHFRDEGVDVHIASFRPACIKGVSVHHLRSFGMGRMGYVFCVPQLKRLARLLQPDVVHAHYVTSYGFVAALARLRPLILTAWGTDVLISPRKSRLMRAVARYATHRADQITTVAEHMNSAVAELGIPREPVLAVPLGVDSRRFHPIVSATLNDPLRLICTRNFAPVYSVHTLLSAIRIAADRGLRLRVDLIGDGPLRSEYEAKIKRERLNGVVMFHGHVAHDELPTLLARADLFVTPAISDGNNVSLNEAMACGCFPIASDIPANSQWIRQGENGFLFPPGDAEALADAIASAAANPDLRRRAAAVNRQIVETSANWEACTIAMAKVYQKAMAAATH